MGKWDRRWIPRRRYNNRKYKDYDYEEPPPSPPSPHHSQSNPPATQDSSGSSWEIDFCKAVRVPWQKVVTAKKYMHCYENVLHWDDSAGEQAFQNAKRTYWEKINGLPSETPLPDPDMYINKIDWNPDIDSGLISDLDWEYFNPDETESNHQLEIGIEKVHNPDIGCDPEYGSNNPWEKGSSRKVDSLKAASTSWGQYDKSISLKKVGNPWEQSASAVKNNPWTRYADESSYWNRGLKCHRQSTVDNSACDNSWNHRCQDVGYFQEKGWRQDDWARNWKQWNINGRDLQISGKNVNTWQNGFLAHTGSTWNKGWEDKQTKNSFTGTIGSERAFQSGWRKREGSFQNRPTYKTAKVSR